MTSPGIPDPIAAGDTLAGLNPTQAALFVMMFVIAALIALFAWREIALGRLIKGLDAIAQAMMAVRIAIAENGLAEKLERAERHRLEDQERGRAQTERGQARKERGAAQAERDKDS
jgi:hypothetical protein